MPISKASLSIAAVGIVVPFVLIAALKLKSTAGRSILIGVGLLGAVLTLSFNGSVFGELLILMEAFSWPFLLPPVKRGIDKDDLPK